MVHDEDAHCSTIPNAVRQEKDRVMSTSIVQVPAGQPWSLCSRVDMQTYMRAGRGHCLFNKPEARKVIVSSTTAH